MAKKILMLCGDYMEDYEAMVPFQALQAYGMAVDAVCPGKKAGDVCRTVVHQRSGQQTYSESRGHNFTLNATFSSIDPSQYRALLIPGGRAAEYLSQDNSVISLIQILHSRFFIPMAATSHGPLVFAAMRMLSAANQFRCTAYPTLKPVLLDAGFRWVEPDKMSKCVEDRNLITGATYESHPELINLFVKAIRGKITGADKKILFLCGDYMEDYEVMVPLQSLQALGCTVDSICPDKLAGDKCPTAIHEFEGDQTYSEKPGHDFTLNADFLKVDVSGYDALVIPGGRAPEYLALNEGVVDLVRYFVKKGKPIASICHGQLILAAAGVLKGRKCTAYPAVKLNVTLAGGTWLEPNPISRCFTDGNLVTGAAWPGHPEFIAQLMALLSIQVSF